MSAYAFRIRFFLEYGSPIDCESVELVIPLANNTSCVLRSIRADQKIKESRHLVITGDGFASENAALETGERVKLALLWLGVKCRVGIDIGDDTARGGVGDYLAKKVLAERGVQLKSDVHGLNVYSTEIPVKFISSTARATVGIRDERVTKILSDACTSDFEPSEKQWVAFALYNLSHFEGPPRARLITLVVTIEALLKRSKRSQEAREHITKLIEITKSSGLDERDRDSILSSLKELCFDSIGRTGRELVDKHLGDAEYGGQKASKFFNMCYGMRSDIMHTGQHKSENLATLVNELDRLVSDLLVSLGRI